MKHTFGGFVLDAEAHTLVHNGTLCDVQPRVLEFLGYLVSNAGRVVPKAELLDQLWPGVTVTESSLHRAASLARSCLEKGGLTNAIQNLSKRGYRFALDVSSLGHLAAPSEQVAEVLSARDALAHRLWTTASEKYRQIASTIALDPDDYERWALADECRGRPVDGIPALIRAIDGHVNARHLDRAGRAAAVLAKIELERGSAAAAQGWVDRAAGLLEQSGDDAANAYALWVKARLAGVAGRPNDAVALSDLALRRADASGDPGLRAVTMVYNGFFRMSLGDVVEGARLQNLAAAIALSSQVDPMSGTLVYCNILWACRTFADWERALQWSDGFEVWCAATFSESPGSCDLHRAEVLAARATLPQAFAKISEALPKLIDEEAWSLGEGYRVRGDIAAMRGDMDQAAADYAAAYSVGWNAEPGHAVMIFEQGDIDGALSALDRALEGRGWYQLQRRGVLLANAARIAALGGLPERAQVYMEQVEDQESRWPQPAVRALLAETRAALLGDDDPQAMQFRLLAGQLWTAAKLDYHVARTRLDLARQYLTANLDTSAMAELSAAEHIAKRVESPRLLRQCAALRGLFDRAKFAA